jgi:hypothetical protein
MSKSFQYYDNWRNEVVECPKCGWKGRVQDGTQRDFQELFDYCCPSCVGNVILAMVSYPTVQQIEQAAKDGNAEAIRGLPEIACSESRNQRFEREKLRSANQLPDLDGGNRFDVLLDTVEHSGDPDDESWNFIKVGDRVIWKELAFWEGYRRYPELSELLQRKYGSRFKQLKASYKAEEYLRGDINNLPFKIYPDDESMKFRTSSRAHR